MNEYRWDLRNRDNLVEAEWETGFESYDDAYEAMSEKLTELIDQIAKDHPEMEDWEIEETFDWEVRME